jgi:toxin ParE1/3/4
LTDNYIVSITKQAREQIREIDHYIKYTLQSGSSANNILDTLEKEISSLSCLPNRIVLTEEEPWHSYGIHKMVVKSYLVYFWIDESMHKVFVTAVVYGRCDQIQQLSKMSF